MLYNTFRKQAHDSDFERSPGYDLVGRSFFWPSMLTFLSDLSKSKKPAKYVVNKGYLSIAKILSQKVSDIISVIVSDRSEQHKKATIPSNGPAEISKSDFVKLAMMDVFSKIVSGES